MYKLTSDPMYVRKTDTNELISLATWRAEAYYVWLSEGNIPEAE